MPLPSLFGSSRRYADAIAAAENASAELTAAYAGTMPVIVGPASPFQPDNHLESVVWADLLGTELKSVTRTGAMTIPAVARHRHLICGVAAKSPLVCLDRTDTRVETPYWAVRTDGELHPFHRMLWTVDDLIFSGWSVWLAGRGADKSLLTATRIAPTRWETDAVGRVLVDGELVDAERLILIPGPHEGILNFGAPTLRRTLDNLDAAANAARNPSAYLELHYTGDEQMTDTEVDKLIARWAKARRGENGGVAYTSKGLEVNEHGTHEAHLLIEGRNADAVDCARLVSNPAAMADATSSGASLTYETTEGRNDQFLDYGAALYMDAVAARLSMDDIVPRGQHMAFNLAATTAKVSPPTGPSLED